MRPFRFILPLLVSALSVAAGLTLYSGDVGAAAGDPVIAAAGDIACDPHELELQRRQRNHHACQQKCDVRPARSAAAPRPSSSSATTSTTAAGTRLPAVLRPQLGPGEVDHSPVRRQPRVPHVGRRTDCNSANAGAAGYFKYFGAAAGHAGKGYYSYDVGTWHLIALNSNCADAGGCGPTSPQGKWLQARPRGPHEPLHARVLAHPAVQLGRPGDANSKALFWTRSTTPTPTWCWPGTITSTSGSRRRTPPRRGSGARHPRVRRRHRRREPHVVHARSPRTARSATTPTFGVLMMTLHSTGYDWSFVPRGRQDLHGTPARRRATAPAAT